MKELSLAIVCVLTMATWTSAQPLADAAVQRALQGPAR